MKKEVSGSRLKRFGRLGWLSRRSIPLAISRMRGLGDAITAEDLDAKSIAKHVAAAGEIFSTLGDMKGLALKLGQMLSYMDGALPPEVQPIYREALAKLQASAPAMPFDAVKQVVEAELGPLERHFSSFEPAPLAAASIGQVHRAMLRDGTAVAVKVQYPGIESAMGADLANLKTLRALGAPLLLLGGGNPTLSWSKEVLAELRARLLEELDYEHEAAMQTRFRQLLRDVPELYVPRVFEHASARRVLTTELVHGRTLAEVAAQDSQQERDRWGTALVRGIATTLYGHGLLYADPHPGNYLFGDDGSVLWLDFGCVKEMPEPRRADMRRYLSCAMRATRTDDPRDWAAFDEAIQVGLSLDPSQEIAYAAAREFFLYCLRPLLTDQVFAFTPEFTAGTFEIVLEAKKKTVLRPGVPRIEDVPRIPADYTFMNRLQWGFFSVLTALRARVNWYREMPQALRDQAAQPLPRDLDTTH